MRMHCKFYVNIILILCECYVLVTQRKHYLDVGRGQVELNGNQSAQGPVDRVQIFVGPAAVLEIVQLHPGLAFVHELDFHHGYSLFFFFLSLL